MENASLAPLLAGFFAAIGAVVCMLGGAVLAARTIGRCRYELARFNAIWKHQSALNEAVSEWRARNPERLAELDRLRQVAEDAR